MVWVKWPVIKPETRRSLQLNEQPHQHLQIILIALCFGALRNSSHFSFFFSFHFISYYFLICWTLNCPCWWIFNLQQSLWLNSCWSCLTGDTSGFIVLPCSPTTCLSLVLSFCASCKCCCRFGLQEIRPEFGSWILMNMWPWGRRGGGADKALIVQV